MSESASIRVPVTAEWVLEREAEGRGIPVLGGRYPLTIGTCDAGTWSLTGVEYTWGGNPGQPVYWATFWRLEP